mmetsp:Transcript_28180/g.76386  ORF Transcript_28180/g.76386 Transcript_28180/m.76386 type:complete len:268 (-) Transcript_28180:271-1074(-)
MRDEHRGILGSLWDSFLYDYDNFEDERNSVYSLDESLFSYDSLKGDASDVNSEIISGRDEQFKGLKMANPIDSFELSTKVTEEEKLEIRTPRHNGLAEGTSVIRRTTAPESNEGREELKIPSRIESSEPLTELFEKELRRNTSRYDELAIHRHIGMDFDLQREGPPSTIFVEDQAGPRNAHLLTGPKSDKGILMSTGLQRREIDADKMKESSVHNNGGKRQTNLVCRDKESAQASLTAIQRKELVRKIALLRIRASKASMARAVKKM